MAEGFQGDQTALMCDGDGGRGDFSPGDGILQDGEGGGKKFVLMLEGVEQGRWGIGGHRKNHDMASVVPHT